MAQYHIREPDELVSCPYDDTHQIRVKRLPYHLMKCRKNYAGHDFQKCPFNARHEIPGPEFRYHLANCPEKAIIEQDILFNANKDNDDGTYFKGNTDVPSYHEWVPPPCSENWDEEIVARPRIGVDPKLLDNPDRPIIRNLVGMSAAQKKAYKKRLSRRQKQKQQGLAAETYDEETDVIKREASGINQSINQNESSHDSGSGSIGVDGVRMPKETPKVLSMAGIGRGIGRGALLGESVPPSGLTAYKAPGAYPTPNHIMGNSPAGRGILPASKDHLITTNHQVPPIGMGRASIINHMGLGKGLGRGLLREIYKSDGFESVNGYADSQDKMIAIDESKKNLVKKLKKKLRQIEELEKSVVGLNDEQLAKVQDKAHILKQLQQN